VPLNPQKNNLFLELYETLANFAVKKKIQKLMATNKNILSKVQNTTGAAFDVYWPADLYCASQ
jgi:hypothetical protein